MCFNKRMEPVRDIWNSYKIPIILGTASVAAICISIVLLVKSTQNTIPIRFSRDEIATGSALGLQTDIVVDVEGAVSSPGIVTLETGARVEDAIHAAGGLADDADTLYVSKTINRAMKVTDGMKIYIPKTGEDMTSHIINVAQSGIASPDQVHAGTLVSVNSASQTELDSLPGVGPVTAQKIIDNRPYGRLEDLVAKKAIGASLFEKLKNMLSL